jgi:hypothetical protein
MSDPTPKPSGRVEVILQIKHVNHRSVIVTLIFGAIFTIIDR